MTADPRFDPASRAYLVAGVLLTAGVVAALLFSPPDAAGMGDEHGGGDHATGILPREQPGLPPGAAPDVTLTVRPGAQDETSFDPARLEVPLGAVVRILFVNDGLVPHTLTVHDFGVDTGVVQPGGSIAVKFRADRAGEFEVMCDEPGHADAGMLATLAVA